MTATTPTRASTRRAALDRNTAMRLAAEEYRRYLRLLRSLAPTDWSRPTDCPAWDVREMATHNLGMAEMASSWREMLRQNALAACRGEVFIDALTALQVQERAEMSPAQSLEAYAAVVEPAARGRRHRSVALARVPMPVTQVVGGVAERWSFGFLYDVVLSRDTWMHRIDTARATGHDPELTPGHDGVLVADIVAEWASRHGRPFALTLTGPAGGRWRHGQGGPETELDAVEFCRILSRRAPGDGLLTTEVPF